jgi:3-hydroxypropanoate dehydrogenase
MNPEVTPVARLLFTEARSHGHWLPRPVDPALLYELYELMKFGPTSMNSQPMRLLFVCDDAERERLAACVNPGNVEKVRSAPVVAVLGQDPGFVELLAMHFPHKKDALAYYTKANPT